MIGPRADSARLGFPDEVSRRKWLGTLGGTAMGLLLSDLAERVAFGAQPQATVRLGSLTKSSFQPLLGKLVAVYGKGTTVNMLLLKVDGNPFGKKAIPSVPKLPVSREPFSITLLSPAGSNLPEGLYTLQHPALGTTEPLFLAPVGQTKPGQAKQYQAVFS
jgi:hypothetical protein